MLLTFYTVVLANELLGQLFEIFLSQHTFPCLKDL